MEELRIQLEPQYSYQQMYKSIGQSRQSYFQSKLRNQKKEQIDSAILTIVRNWRKQHCKMGSRVMYKSLQAAGIELSIGITRFEKLLSAHGLTVKKFKTRFPKTTDSNGVNKFYPNLTNGLKINDINQLIVADITYIYILDNWHYLFIFKDVYSQRILSIIPSVNMFAENCVTAIHQIIALRGIENLKTTICHTDNGKQFDAKIFKSIIVDKVGMQISRAKTSQQNGSAEQLNHIVKNMYLSNWKINSYPQFIESCNRVKYLNNYERAIEQLGYKTPNQFEQEIKTLPIKKRKEKQLYDFSR